MAWQIGRKFLVKMFYRVKCEHRKVLSNAKGMAPILETFAESKSEKIRYSHIFYGKRDELAYLGRRLLATFTYQ